MNRLLLFCISFLIFSANIEAQEGRICTDYDFSPQAFSMITSGAIQPNLNTGTLNVTIPVYVWEDEDFRIPIQLCYSTNGFKPARQTGIVGMGWSCQIGGTITRQIVGLDDIANNYGCYYKTNNSYTNEGIYKLEAPFFHDDSLGATMIKGHETNPDVFHFNFMNYSGHFMIDTDGNFKVFSSNGERGCYEVAYIGGNYKKFLIKTGDGYEYHFGSSYKSKEYLYLCNPVYATINYRQPSTLTDDQMSIIAWHLDEIVAPNGRKLKLYYSSTYSRRDIPLENDDICTTFAQGLFSVRNDNAIEPDLNPFSIYKYPSITTVSYLDHISLVNSNSAETPIIDLNYSQKEYKEVDTDKDNRIYYDLICYQKKLNEVTFFDHSAEPIGNLSLSYIYKDTRMLLNQISISSIGTYRFTYNTTESMPGILTNAQDLWGFYNGRTDLQDNNVIPVEVDGNYDEHLTGDYKNPNSAYSILGTLKSMTYPTGGRTEFEYEANTADRILLRRKLSSYIIQEAALTAELDTTNQIIGPVIHQDPYLPSLKHFDETYDFQECGGVRIKSISDYNDTTCMYRRTYSYNIPGTDTSSGIVLKFNRYFSEQRGNILVYNPFIKFPDNSLDILHMAYSYVTEHFPDGSYKIYRFTDYLMHPDEFSSFKKDVEGGLEYPSLAYGTFMNNISREPNSRHYRRGLIKSIEDYSNDNNLLFKKEYKYEDSDSSYIAYIIGSGKYWWSAKRFTCDYLLKSIKETYYRNGSISTLKSFAYNSAGQKTLESISDITGMNGKRTYYRYCNEVGSSYGENIYKNVPSDIIQTTMRNGMEYLVSNTQLLYDTSSKNPNPIQIRKYCIQTPILVSATQSQDAFINTGRNQPYIKTLYTYNGQHRLTKVQEDGNSYISYVWDGDMNHVIQKTINTPEQTFTYTWKDMVGLSSATSPTGVGETYQYDVLNRLEAIHDSQGKITRQYFYHIYNE